MVRKRVLVPLCALACALSAVFCLPARAAIEIDGVVGYLEWADCPKTELIRVGEQSLCGITDAAMRSKTAANRVLFGFTAHAPDVTGESPIGAALFVGGQMIARWQQGLTPEYDAENYSLRGAAHVPEDDVLSSFSFELELGCKTADALQALRGLQLRLYDPQGVLSRQMACPVDLPETTTTAATTRTTAPPGETTTKPPATTKETTTKPAPTTTKTTTKPTPTTAKTTATAKPTSAAATSITTTALTSPAPKATAPPQAATAPPQGESQVIWYTVIITETTADLALWIDPPTAEGVPAEVSEHMAQTDLTARNQGPAPASQRGALLYGTAALLFALAVVLVVFWLRMQKKPSTNADSSSDM